MSLPGVGALLDDARFDAGKPGVHKERPYGSALLSPVNTRAAPVKKRPV
jgi:hypothetical protein